MQILVVDANFLISAFRFKVDPIEGFRDLVPGGYKLVTSSAVISELEGISKSRSPSGKGAAFALEFLKREGAEVVRTEKRADDWILDYSSSSGGIPCTNDSALRKLLRDRGVRSIVLKGRSRLDYE